MFTLVCVCIKEQNKTLDSIEERVQELPFNRKEMIEFQDSVQILTDEFLYRLYSEYEYYFENNIIDWKETKDLIDYINN